MWVVIATPPKTGLFADLLPRAQMWNDGTTVIYDSKEEAQLQADICKTDHNGWSYSVVEENR